MCAEKYLSNNKSALFSVEDDVDDDEFLRRPANSGNPPTSVASSSSDHQRLEGRRLELLQQQKETEQRSVESTQRSLSLLRNSEQIGIATAEELMKQREQLERTDKRLDDINVMLRASHRHIEGIKSVFGSFKNYLQGKKDAPTPEKSITAEAEARQSPSNLSQTLSASASASKLTQDDHPGLRIKGLGSDDELRNRPENPRQVIDENLDEMVSSLSRLKGLARGLGDEIESQNDLIDKILPKVDRSDITLERQNKDMKRLLK
ncbi:synaptosomal-associated protein 29 [Nilaparvata lugens]|uniref:synaptosomal-associated protein 29 n=1 Tax=Nilaparvata lugens TaxID=108931 RepID=UPI00193E2A51|nr:synaptosomal-associated protein 29 [Nilaparvata lugens]XP_039287049.1 synaptosomal-associated protein 29 [Nilaparvata lugens]